MTTRVLLLLLVVGACVLCGCRRERRSGEDPVQERLEFPPPTESEKGDVLVTAYCNCGDCCGWEYSLLGFGPPVYTYGPQKGQRKKVGVTARGTKARLGTVAADPNVYPFGTRLHIPGYGTGVVEDVGGGASKDGTLTCGCRRMKRRSAGAAVISRLPL